MAAAGLLALGPEFWEALARPAKRGKSPYGPLQAPDANGLRLPDGFSSRVLARGGQTVPGTLYPWHIFPDGGATFATPDGGWILVSNSEVPTPVDLPIDPPLGNPGEGGASAIRFKPSGEIESAYRILSGTSSNCAGGPTPWGTWLSCEEVDDGLVWECDPTGEQDAIAHPALGVFNHEAVCVDRKTGFVYLSEDEGDGAFYRFRPKRRRDLSSGVLEVAALDRKGLVDWIRVPDPGAASGPLRGQVAAATRFRRGEGIWFDSGVVYLATTADSRIWAYNARKGRMKVLYDPEKLKNPPLTDVDNITVAKQSGDLYVCEDNGGEDPFDIAIITPQVSRGKGRRPRAPKVARFAKLTGIEHGDPSSKAVSEVAGVCFSPDGSRLYFSSQRAAVTGATYEVTGPFRRSR
ncbi:DUF839 domain-containing protein [soil metagenome]